MLRELFTKIYSRINWKNRSEAMTTALGATLLNKMDYTLNEVDNRIVTLDAVKAEESEVQQMIKGWNIDVKTGIITVTKKNGERTTYDLNVEKIPVSFTLSQQGILTMTTDDGTKFTANIGSLIPILTFIASDTINVSVEGSGINKTYSFSVKEGSIKDKHLQPSYLADITVQAQTASSSANEAQTQSDRAKNEADRAKNEADRARLAANEATQVVGLDLPLSVENGGTGQTTSVNAANSLLNALSIGSDIPKDNDYYISQYVNGGTKTTTYHRRPIYKIWDYIKTKTLPVASGGTGQTSARNAANAFINALDEGRNTPTDPDLFLTQYVGGGSTNTTYVRRPMSALWDYIRSKNVYAEGTIEGTSYIDIPITETGVYLVLAMGLPNYSDTSGRNKYLAAFCFKYSLYSESTLVTGDVRELKLYDYNDYIKITYSVRRGVYKILKLL